MGEREEKKRPARDCAKEAKEKGWRLDGASPWQVLSMREARVYCLTASICATMRTFFGKPYCTP